MLRDSKSDPMKAVVFCLFSCLSLLLLAGGCARRDSTREHARALAALREGNAVVAKGLLEQALTNMPRDAGAAPAYNDLGRAYLALGDWDNAATAFRASRRLDPSFAVPAYNLGVLHFQAGEMETALERFLEATQLDPADAAALAFAGHAAMELGDHAAAVTHLERALARRPGSAPLLNTLAVALARNRKMQPALDRLEEALRIDEQYAPAHFNRAVLLEQTAGHSEEAMRSLETFLVRSSDEARMAEAQRAMQMLGRGAPVGVPGRVEPAPRAEPVDPDEEDATQAPALPERDGSLAENALASLRRAQALATRGQVDEAADLFRAAAQQAAGEQDAALQERILVAGITACPEDAGVMQDYGEFLNAQGRYERALRAFKQAVLRNPHEASTYIGMAEAARQTGQRDAAEAALNRALRIHRANADGLQALARLYEDEGRAQAAMELYQELLRSFPRHPEAPRFRSRIQVLQLQARASAPEPPSIEPVVEPVVEPAPVTRPTAPVEPPPSVRPAPVAPVEPTTPRDPGAAAALSRNPRVARDWYNRGMIYKARADWDSALLHFRRAIEQDDSFVAAYNEMGVVFHQKGEPSSAMQMYRRALEMSPNEVATRYNMARLQQETGRPEEALTQIEEILRIRPDFAPAHYLLGIMYAEHPLTLHLAAKHYRIFLRLAPNDEAAPAVRQWINQYAPQDS